MGTKRRIQKTTGYPATDGSSFDTYKEAIKHQTYIDINKSIKNSLIPNKDDDKDAVVSDVLDFIEDNLVIVQEYIKHHLIPKKAAPKKTVKPQAAAKKTANKEAVK